jgi:hypothetical protein
MRYAMNKSFYDADKLLNTFKVVKQAKCKRCIHNILGTNGAAIKACKDCDMKFIVDVLEAFPRSVIIQDAE